MKRTLSLLLALVLCASLLGGCGGQTATESAAPDRADADIDWQYMSAEDTKAMLDNGEPVLILDSRPDDMYNAGHIPGAYHLPCYPVDTPELEQLLVDAAADLKALDAPSVIVCKTGNKGAKRAISVLIDQGVPAEQLYILEGGGEGWTYEDYLTTENDSPAEPTVLGDASTGSVTADVTVAKTKVYVPAQWIKELVDGSLPQSSDYVILEASWGEPSDDYKAAHIPGAVHINTDDVESPEYWNLRSPEEITALMSKLGITKDTTVVVYGDSGGAAARVAFTCLWAGVEEVHVLDGGFEAWTAAGYDTASGVEESTATTADFGVTIPAHPEYVLSMPEDVIEAQKDPNFRLISIRSWEEFTGETSGYSYIDRVGEPEGAVWGHNTEDYYHEDGTVKSVDELKDMWAEWDISTDNILSFYCGTGWRACVPFLICYEAGMTNMNVYDGGWFAWQLDESLPVQLGDPRA